MQSVTLRIGRACELGPCRRAQRYYNHSAATLSPVEAARIAAALPAPRSRAVNGASGFTFRHGNAIAARIGVVRRDGLDACVYR